MPLPTDQTGIRTNAETHFRQAFDAATEAGVAYAYDGKTLVFVASNVSEDQMAAREMRPIIEGLYALYSKEDESEEGR